MATGRDHGRLTVILLAGILAGRHRADCLDSHFVRAVRVRRSQPVQGRRIVLEQSLGMQMNGWHVVDVDHETKPVR